MTEILHYFVILVIFGGVSLSLWAHLESIRNGTIDIFNEALDRARSQDSSITTSFCSETWTSIIPLLVRLDFLLVDDAERLLRHKGRFLFADGVLHVRAEIESSAIATQRQNERKTKFLNSFSA